MIPLIDLLDDHQTGHSEFQDDFFITVKAGGTEYGQYKQALRELYKRLRGLRELTCDKEILGLEIEDLAGKVFIDTDEVATIQYQKDKVELKRKSMLMEEAERVITNTKREFIRFYQQAAYLKEKVGELTDEKRKQLDVEMWVYRIKEMIAIDYLTMKRVSGKALEMISILPPEARQGVNSFLVSPMEKTTDWYMARHDNELSEFPELQEPEQLKLLSEWIII